VKKFAGWGIIKPTSSLSATLGLFEDEPIAWTVGSSATMGVTAAFASVALAGVVLGVRRKWQQNRVSEAATIIQIQGEEQELLETQ